MGKWINVEDRLPEHYSTVLVTDGEFTALGTMNRVSGLQVCHTGYQEMFWPKLTHWMPLPEPPK